jgi:hypothetical protein
LNDWGRATALRKYMDVIYGYCMHSCAILKKKPVGHPTPFLWGLNIVFLVHVVSSSVTYPVPPSHFPYPQK